MFKHFFEAIKKGFGKFFKLLASFFKGLFTFLFRIFVVVLVCLVFVFLAGLPGLVLDYLNLDNILFNVLIAIGIYLAYATIGYTIYFICVHTRKK